MQYNRLGQTAVSRCESSPMFQGLTLPHLLGATDIKMGMELVSETLDSFHTLMWLCAQEDVIE